MAAETVNKPQKWTNSAEEIVIHRINWPLIALGAIGVLALANLMLYVRNKEGR
jgi:hypothetical protein